MLGRVEWHIYNFLKEQSENGKWTHQSEIQDYLKSHYGEEISLRRIRRLIQSIRTDDVIQKVILTDYNKGYKLISPEDEVKLLRNRKISILKMLKQYWRDVGRLNLNEQEKLAFDSDEREVFESILKSKKKGE